MKTKFLYLVMVLCLAVGSFASATPVKAVDGYQVTGFWNDPAIPSIYDGTAFGLQPDAPPDILTCLWNFGDGSTSTECFVWNTKFYAKDGDYTVSVEVVDTTTGRESFASRTVSVRTHDVAITRFSVPQSASTGQTRQLTVYVRNTRYPETVQVELYKNDMVWIGTHIQDIPVRPANRTTAYSFNYTFTAEDARIGKVTFRAQAFITGDNGPDDWPVDNDVTTFPTRVSR